MKQKKNGTPPETEARAVLKGMLLVTAVLIVVVGAASFLSVTARSIILISWMALMIAVLRRYHL